MSDSKIVQIVVRRVFGWLFLGGLVFVGYLLVVLWGLFLDERLIL